MNIKSIATLLERGLSKELPGTDIQWEMASSDRKIENFPRYKRDDSKLAAVLILLYPYEGSVGTLFMQRPEYNGVHSGQISFPGGKMEETDINLIETAIRETCEETGICNDTLRVLGTLTPLFIPVSNIEVTPVVAISSVRPDFYPSEEEVVHLIEARLKSFFDTDIIKEKPMQIREEILDVRYYDYEGNIIWGATAMILNELITLLQREKVISRQ